MAKDKKKEKDKPKSYTRENRPKGVSKREWDVARKKEGKSPNLKFYADPAKERKAKAVSSGGYGTGKKTYAELTQTQKLEADKFLNNPITQNMLRTFNNPLFKMSQQVKKEGEFKTAGMVGVGNVAPQISSAEKKQADSFIEELRNIPKNIENTTRGLAEKYSGWAQRMDEAKGPTEKMKNLRGIPLVQPLVESGAALGDVALRTSPLEPIRNAYAGIKNINQPGGFRQGVIKDQSRKLMYESVSGQDATTTAGMKGFVGRAMEAPTYAYSGVKAFAGKLAGNFLSRTAVRAVQSLPEATIMTIIQAVEKDKPIGEVLKELPRDFLMNEAAMTAFSTVFGEVGRLKAKGMNVGKEYNTFTDAMKDSVGTKTPPLNVQKVKEIVEGKPKPDPLIQEARKYSTPEEFSDYLVKNQNKIKKSPEYIKYLNEKDAYVKRENQIYSEMKAMRDKYVGKTIKDVPKSDIAKYDNLQKELNQTLSKKTLAPIPEGTIKTVDHIGEKGARNHYAEIWKDAQSQPLQEARKLYHGTTNKFDKFETPKTSGIYGRGTYFYDSPKKARSFAGKNGRVVEAYVKAGKMATEKNLDDALLQAKQEGITGSKSYHRATDILQEKGFVGLRDADVTVVFDTKNISQPLQEGATKATAKMPAPEFPTQPTTQPSLPNGKVASVLPEADGGLVRGDTRQSISYNKITDKQRKASQSLIQSQGEKIADPEIRQFREQNLLGQETVDEIILRKRGVITDKEAVEAAKRYKVTIDDIVNTPVGTVPTKEKMTAMSQVIQEQREITKKLRKLAEGGGKAQTPEERQLLQSMGMSHMSEQSIIQTALEENTLKLKKAEIALMAAKSEAGRSLQGAKQAIDAVDSRLRIVYNSMKNRPPLEQQAVLETISKYPIENDKNFIKMLEDLNNSDIFDKVAEFSVAAKLWNTTTHVVNTGSNIIRQVADMAITDVTNPKLAKADAIGAFTGLKSGLRSAWRAMTDEGYASQLAKYAETGGKTGAIKGTLGKIVRTPFRLLGAGDEIFKGVAYQRSLYRQAARLADGDTVKMKSLLEKPTFAMMDEAAQQAKRMTYQEEMGEITRAINKFRDPSQYKTKAGKAVGVITRSFLSFLKTPTNLIKQSADFSPLGFLKNGKEIVQGLKAGGVKGEQARRLLGEATIGTGLAIASWEASGKDGFITGNAPKDPKERDLFYKQGKLPYAVKFNGKWYQYKRVEPFSTVVGAVADLHDLVDEGDTSFGTIVNKITGQLKDKTYLQGIDDLMNLLTGEKWEQEDAARNMILGSTIPSIFGHTARSIDENIRDARTFTDKAKSQIPFISEGLKPQHDFFGDEKKRQTPWPWVNPIASSEENKDPILNELKRLEDADYSATPTMVDKDYGQDFQEVYGKKVRAAYENIITSPEYKTLSDAEKQKILEGARADAKEETKGQMLLGGKTPTSTYRNDLQYYKINDLMKQGKVTEANLLIEKMSKEDREIFNRKRGTEKPEWYNPESKGNTQELSKSEAKGNLYSKYESLVKANPAEAKKLLNSMDYQAAEMFKKERTASRASNTRQVNEYLSSNNPEEAVRFVESLIPEEKKRILNAMTGAKKQRYLEGKLKYQETMKSPNLDALQQQDLKDFGIKTNVGPTPGASVSAIQREALRMDTEKAWAEMEKAGLDEDSPEADAIWNKNNLSDKRFDIVRQMEEAEAARAKGGTINQYREPSLIDKVKNKISDVWGEKTDAIIAKFPIFGETRQEKQLRNAAFKEYPFTEEATGIISEMVKVNVNEKADGSESAGGIEHRPNPISIATMISPKIWKFFSSKEKWEDETIGNPTIFPDKAVEKAGEPLSFGDQIGKTSEVTLNNVRGGTVGHEFIHSLVRTEGFPGDADEFNRLWEESKSKEKIVPAIDEVMKNSGLYEGVSGEQLANERLAFLGGFLGRKGKNNIPSQFRKYYNTILK